MGVLTLETNKYSLKLDNFEGPLDLLVHLIDKNKMDIYDIKLSQITDQYIEYINEMEKQNLDITSEFLVIASTLLFLKSKELLPKEVEEEAELSEEELLRRIIEYKKYKDITEKLAKMYSKAEDRFYGTPQKIELPKQKLERKYEKEQLYASYKRLMDKEKAKINRNAKNMEKIALIEQYTVTSKVREIFKELSRNKRFVFGKVFSAKARPRAEVVTAFSGVLELTRRNKITTKQEELFGDILIEKANKEKKRM